jgi:predicted house-cleaning noncanonical NTP pyrophosphatase (MazG superfamily)
MRFNKLVRDKVPDIIEKKGKTIHIHTAKRKEFKKLLRKKLREEVSEYLRDGSPETLVDALEVIYALAGMDGVTKHKLEKLRKEKSDDRGSFDEGIVLDEIKDND